MSSPRLVRRIAFPVALLFALAAPPVFAQLQRAFVASYGIDANPCSLPLPCRTFGAAISKVISGGEVVALDSAGYGPTTVVQSVSIIAPEGVYAGVTVFAGTGVAVNAPLIRVVLRNLAINALGGSQGVQVQQAAEVHVVGCTISNFATGIETLMSGAVLHVRDTALRTNVVAIHIGAPSVVEIDNVGILETATTAIVIDGAGTGTIRRSVVANSGGAGIALTASSTALSVEDTLLADNAGDAIAVTGGGIRLTAARTTMTRNNHGVAVTAPGPGLAEVDVANSTIAQNRADGLFASGAGATIVSNANTFSLNVGHALFSTPGGTILTAKGADGLPNNAGEQATPTGGTVTPLNPF